MAEDQGSSAMEVDETKVGKLEVDEQKEVVDEAIASCSKKEELYVCELEHDEALLVCLLEELMQVEYSRVEMSRAE